MNLKSCCSPRVLRAVVAPVVLMSCVLSAQAEEIYTRITGPQLMKIMQAEGYAVSLDRDGDLEWKLDGFRNLIVVSSDKESLQFVSSFSDGNATLAKINQWNSSRRYSRSYLDERGYPVLKLDLDLAGGVTRARLLDYVLTCRTAAKRWISEVVE